MNAFIRTLIVTGLLISTICAVRWLFRGEENSSSHGNVVALSFHPQAQSPRRLHAERRVMPAPPSIEEKTSQPQSSPVVPGAFPQPQSSPVVAQTSLRSQSQPMIPVHQPEEVIYHVEPGDRLDKISMKFYETHHRHKAILEANPGLDPKRMRPGQKIVIPHLLDHGPKPKTVFISRPVASSREYVVQRGDVLSRIAERELGSMKLVPKILEMNPGLKPARLKVGQSLRLPLLDSKH